MADRDSRLVAVLAGCWSFVLAAAITGCSSCGTVAVTPSKKNPQAACKPVESAMLPVVLKAQEADLWCWIASPQMAMNFLGATPPVSQCAVASIFFNSRCCPSPGPQVCDQGSWPGPVFAYYQFDFNRRITGGGCSSYSPSGNDNPLTLDELKWQISCQKKPVVFIWHYDGCGSHVFVVVGYEGDLLWIMDPLPMPNSDPNNPTGGQTFSISYDAFLSGSYDDPQTGQNTPYHHWIDYYDITHYQ